MGIVTAFRLSMIKNNSPHVAFIIKEWRKTKTFPRMRECFLFIHFLETAYFKRLSVGECRFCLSFRAEIEVKVRARHLMIRRYKEYTDTKTQRTQNIPTDKAEIQAEQLPLVPVHPTTALGDQIHRLSM